ncbi:hypothetical protein BCR36DRAFT_346952 [Piromyces finnis]|uniref:Cilia- and flagella-associated protein 69 ARM repeats domain-containing protein n=1 Tax=Piromyces finnis TaxID=1754191 RepID=A0A1Y1VFV9_9FUNG|nr:hypothetical protein BCR36DRAFT_346952 [Piromyces finnis]|eukprot:ORX55288.1 hypothetical protein BCR36DRAFT_346952 [Piromyces finnis]
MESCTPVVSENQLILINNKDQISNKELKNIENIQEQNSKISLKNELILNPLLSDRDDNENKPFISPSASSILSENELKEIEKAYQLVDDYKSGRIKRIDPTRFLHSLPDGAYPQLPKLKKYTTLYTSNVLFPQNNNNNGQIQCPNVINNIKESNINNTLDNNNNDSNMESEKSDNYISTLSDSEKRSSKKIEDIRNENQLSSLNNYDEIEIDKTYRNLMPKFTDMIKVKKINFPMIMDVLNGKRTCLLYERHATIIKKLVGIITETMKDEYIPWLIDIIDTLRQKILQGGDILVKPLIDLIESIKIYDFLNHCNTPLENIKIKLLNTILKTILIPNHKELCYCILKTISNFSNNNKNDTLIPPIDPPILNKPLSQESLNIYFNLYYFKQSSKSFQIIEKSKVINYLLDSPYISTNSEVQISLLLTLKTLLQSNNLYDKFLNHDGMNLLCKFINSMSNVKNFSKKKKYDNEYSENNKGSKIFYEVPVTPHQSLGDLSNINKNIEENDSKCSNINRDTIEDQIISSNDSQCEFNSTDLDEKSTSTLTITKPNTCDNIEKLKLDFDSIYVIIEIFLYIIDTRRKKDAIMQMANKESISNLKNIYEQICVSVKREIHKNIRNDLVTFFSRILEITMISSKKLTLLFYKANLTKTIYNELVKKDSIFMKKIIPIDFEYKQILLNILCYLCHSKENINLLSDLGFLEFSLKYLTFENNEYTKYLNIMQLKQFQLQILDILNSMLKEKSILKRWYKCNGCQYIFKYLPDAIFNESGLSDGCNIISSTVGLIPSTLKVILFISQLGIYMKTHLGNLGIFKIVLEIIKNNSDCEIIQLGLMICSSLCYDCMQNKDIFSKEGGVEIIAQKLKYQNPNKNNEKLILISTIDCIWKTICGCKKSEFKFFENEGIELMLNLVENKKEIRNYSMGCLLDLMENINARSYMLLWRSTNNSSIGVEQLLINLWIEIENSIGVSKINNNIISNTQNPLHSDKYERDNVKLKENIELNESCAINEMKEDCRVKIFSMFEILGFDTFDSTLTIDQKIYLEYIKKFLDFKIGEIWDEIIDELNIRGIRPITPDNDYIMAIHCSLNKKGENVQKFQQELTNMKNKLQMTENNYFMEELQQIERIKYESLEREKYQNKIKQAFKSQNK